MFPYPPAVYHCPEVGRDARRVARLRCTRGPGGGETPQPRRLIRTTGVSWPRSIYRFARGKRGRLPEAGLLGRAGPSGHEDRRTDRWTTVHPLAYPARNHTRGKEKTELKVPFGAARAIYATRACARLYRLAPHFTGRHRASIRCLYLYDFFFSL